jgi:hypothetical protein
MKQQATLGTNCTGMAAAAQRGQEMLAGMEEFPPSSQCSAKDIAMVRSAYAKEAEPLGSVPQPVGMRNKVRTAAQGGGSAASSLTRPLPARRGGCTPICIKLTRAREVPCRVLGDFTHHEDILYDVHCAKHIDTKE